jgi:hypothetical protein
MQKRLLEIVFSERYAALHHKPYSLISNPHDARYQNCNEFMLDVTAAAVWQTDDRAQLKANLSEAFKPQDLDVGPLQRFLAPISNSTIKRDDHDGGFATTTYSSLRRFYEANGLAAEAFILPFAESAQGE